MLLKHDGTTERRSLSKAEQAERNRRIFEERWICLTEEIRLYGSLGEPQEVIFEIEV